jgi:hypothetical protein
MKTSNDTQNPRLNDPVWDLLGEFPLNELLVDMDLRDKPESGLLFQAIRDLGVRSVLLDIIEKKLIVFATEAQAQLSQRRLEAPIYVRLFCHIKPKEDDNSTKSSSRHKAAQTSESRQLIHRYEPDVNGGWGYFLVERGAGSQVGSSASNCNWIDLYLYKEGE